MTNGSQTVRVFVALDLPQQAKDILQQTVLELKNALPSGIRWVDPAGIHLTLKFLGNVDVLLVGDLLTAMERAVDKFESSSLTLVLSGLGVFPNSREPRVLWAGVTGNMDALRQLQVLVDEALFEIGFAREGRPFRPHLTLGRIGDRAAPAERHRVSQALTTSGLTGTHSWEACEVHLIRSTLTPRGAIYDSIGVKHLPASEQVQE